MRKARPSQEGPRSLQCNVWFNKPLSSAYLLFNSIRQVDETRHYRICCTHPRADFIGFRSADLSAQEPSTRDDQAYLDFALDLCKRHEIRILAVTHRASLFAAQQEPFAGTGTKVIVPATAEVLKTLENKEHLYQVLANGPSVVSIPEHTVVRNVAEFSAAVAALGADFRQLCIKPVVSMYGLGFRRLRNGGSELKRIIQGDVTSIGTDHLLHLMEAETDFPPLMVMRYLEGAERSVDCLADHGVLRACVTRRKSETHASTQELEDNPAIEEDVRSLVARLGLNGVFNVQFKESDGCHYLLEINARMSGGLPFTTLSGVNLAYWMLRIAEDPEAYTEIPRPRTGRRYIQFTDCVEVPNE